MLRTILLALTLGLVAAPAAAALVTETLHGRVEVVDTATGVAVGAPVKTVITFDDAAPLSAGLFDVTSIDITLPMGVMLDETDDLLGGVIQVGWDGAEVTSVFATLGIASPAYGFAGGTLEFLAFGDGSLDFLVSSGTGTAFEGTVVPVPAALPLLATGMAVLAVVRHRRRRADAA